MQKVPAASSTWRHLSSRLRKYSYMYLLCLPGIGYFLVFSYVPMYFLQAAFRDYSVFTGLRASPWVGLRNFADLLSTKYFLQAVSNTLILFAMKMIVGFFVPVLLSLLLNELTMKYFSRGVQNVLYFPHFLSWVIVGGIWATILNPAVGIVNQALGVFGVEPIFFMADKAWFRWVLVFTDVWKECGWRTVIYIAAISGIDQQLYEAAAVDGITKLRRIWYITLPSLVPTMLIMFVLSFANVLRLFEQVFVMYNPLVAEVSETLDTYIYKISLQSGRISLGVAAGLIQGVLSGVLVVLTQRLAGRIRGQELL